MRYQPGAMLSLRLRRNTRATWSATRSGRATRRPKTGIWRKSRCGKPGVSTKPGLTVCTRTPRGGDRPREGELGVLRGRIRARGRKGNQSRDRDDVDDVRGCGRLEPGQKRAYRPDRAEVVDADRLLDGLRIGPQESTPSGDAGAVDEQPDPGMPRENLPRDALDAGPVRDVAHLVLAADLGGDGP